MIDPKRLFERLDMDQDGELGPTELKKSAMAHGWGWYQAPYYALIHLASVKGGLDRDRFCYIMKKSLAGPYGPYGDILSELTQQVLDSAPADAPSSFASSDEVISADPSLWVERLEEILGGEMSDRCKSLLESLVTVRCSRKETALLLIDPQRSFTDGAWMRSIGRDAANEVMPIRLAFENCGDFLRQSGASVERLVTRCPFPPDSYGWDDAFAGILDEAQPYFIKPGNSIIRPRTNGSARRLEKMITQGKRTVVIGGCTLNSCIRVSAVDLVTRFRNAGLKVIADLSLCGARLSNYRDSPEFGDISSVEAAVHEMLSNDITVALNVRWN